MEFVSLISSEANEISEKEQKKTIGCEHVVTALKELGFDSYVGPVLDAAEEHKRSMAVSEYCPATAPSSVLSLTPHSRERRSRAKRSRAV